MDELNPAIIEAIQKQVEAKYAEVAELKRQNDLNEASLTEVRRLRGAEQQRVRLAFDTHDKITGLLNAMPEMVEKIRHINEQVKKLESWLERTDDILVLLLTANQEKKDEARDDLQELIDSRKKSSKRQLKRRISNLNKLKEQAAIHGIEIPLHLSNQIEAEEEEIERLLSE